MILLIDNYDSFTYNLADLFGQLGCEVDVRRNDTVTPDEAEALAPSHLVVSPGPGRPAEAGVSATLIERFAGRVPVLGVCLGHQCIGEVFGWEVNRADRLMHGKVSEIHHDDRGVFAGLRKPFVATRYHSLVVRPDRAHDDLEVSAWTDDPGQPQIGRAHV